MSKVKGACTGMVGCRPEAGCHALKRTPATASPERPVPVLGRRPAVHVTTWRGPSEAAGARAPRGGAAPDEAAAPPLRALDRGIDVAHGAAARALLAEHVPGLER